MAAQVPITGVDHAIVGVRKLEAARRQWARLGFTITPRGRHKGWGTANYCIMFETDYVELLGIVDPALFTNKLDRFLKIREGLMGLAFATETADSLCTALDAAAIDYKGPADLSRLLELPEGTVEPAFKLVYLNGATPGVSSFVCQHLTRELVWRPEWTRHANGATGIESMTVVVRNARTPRAGWRTLLGEGAVTGIGEREFSVMAGRTELRFLAEADARQAMPDLARRKWRPPFLAGMVLAVDDPDRTVRALEAGGVRYRREGRDTVAVGGSLANGVSLEFCAA